MDTSHGNYTGQSRAAKYCNEKKKIGFIDFCLPDEANWFGLLMIAPTVPHDDLGRNRIKHVPGSRQRIGPTSGIYRWSRREMDRNAICNILHQSNSRNSDFYLTFHIWQKKYSVVLKRTFAHK